MALPVVETALSYHVQQPDCFPDPDQAIDLLPDVLDKLVDSLVIYRVSIASLRHRLKRTASLLICITSRNASLTYTRPVSCGSFDHKPLPQDHGSATKAMVPPDRGRSPKQNDAHLLIAFAQLDSP